MTTYAKASLVIFGVWAGVSFSSAYMTAVLFVKGLVYEVNPVMNWVLSRFGFGTLAICVAAQSVVLGLVSHGNKRGMEKGILPTMLALLLLNLAVYCHDWTVILPR